MYKKTYNKKKKKTYKRKDDYKKAVVGLVGLSLAARMVSRDQVFRWLGEKE